MRQKALSLASCVAYRFYRETADFLILFNFNFIVFYICRNILLLKHFCRFSIGFRFIWYSVLPWWGRCVDCV